MVALVKALAEADADYRANRGTWGGHADKAKAVAKWSGGKPENVPAAMALYGFPSLQEQASPRGSAAARAALRPRRSPQQANFLKDQGRLTSVAPTIEVRHHGVRHEGDEVTSGFRDRRSGVERVRTARIGSHDRAWHRRRRISGIAVAARIRSRSCAPFSDTRYP